MSAYPLPANPARPFTTWDHVRVSAYWFGANFIWGGFFGPVLANHVEHLTTQSAYALGLIYSFAALPAILIPLLVGPFSDRCQAKVGRRRPFILSGAALGVLSLIFMGFAFTHGSLLGYVVAYFCLQVGANVALGAYMGVIPDIVPKDQVGKASGMMAMMSQLGTLTGIVVTGFIFKANVGSVYAMAAVLGAFAIYTWVTLDETPLVEAPPPFQWKQFFLSLWIDPRKYPDFAWVWLTRALMMLAFYMVQPVLFWYLRDVIRVPDVAMAAAETLGLILVFATVSGYLGGRLSDKIGRKRIVTLSTMLISVACLCFIGLHTLLAALVVGIFFGIGYGAYISVDWALGTDVLPKEDEAATDMAVWHIAMTLPQVVGAFISTTLILNGFRGAIIQHDGKDVQTYVWPGYAFIFALAAVVFFASGMLVKKVKGST